MKLNTLLEAWENTRLYNRLRNPALRDLPDLRSMRNFIDGEQSNPKHKFMGAGANAYVYARDDQQELDNVYRLADKTDGGQRYLQAIADSDEDIQNNPFLPKVRKVVAPNDSDRTRLVVTERLYPLLTPKLATNLEMMVSIYHRLFKVAEFRGFIEQIENDVIGKELSIEQQQSVAEELLELFVNIISRSLNNKMSPTSNGIRDKQLVEAIRFIRKVQILSKSRVDLHNENLMWRMTGNMPQLVITDPIM